MKAKNRIPAALLSSKEQPRIWTVSVKLPKDNWAELAFSQKEQAVAEFNKIKAAGIFGGQWVESVTLDESAS